MSNHATQVHLATSAKSRFEAEAAKPDYGHIAPDCAGLNFYAIDRSFQASLRVNMDARQIDLGLVDILERVRDGERGAKRSSARPKGQHPGKRIRPGRRERDRRKGKRR